MTEFALFSLACRSSVILGLLVFITFVAGRRWPTGCSIWKRVGIVSLLILPAAVNFAPTIDIPLLSVASLGNTPSLPTPTSIEELLALPDFEKAPTTEPSPVVIATPIETRPVDPLLGTGAMTRASHSTGQSLIRMLTVIYGCVVIILFVRLVDAFRSMTRLCQTGTEVTDSEWLRLIDEWTKTLKLRREIAVCVSDAVAVPLTFGWRSPVILIPRRCFEGSESTQKEAILIHELTHIANKDFFWKVLSHFMTAMYWAHPLAWLVRRDGDILRERLCDRYCSEQLGSQAYARALIEIAKRSTEAKQIGHAFGLAMAQRSSIRRRLNELSRLQLSSHGRSGTVKQSLVVGAAALALGLIVLCMLTERVQRPSNSAPVATAPSDEDPELIADWEEFHQKSQIDPSRRQGKRIRPTVPPITWPDDTAEFNAQVAATVNGIPISNGRILSRYSGYLISVRDGMLAAVNDSSINKKKKKPTIEDYQKIREKLIQQDIFGHVQQVALAQDFKSGMTSEQLERTEAHLDELFILEIEKLKRELNVKTRKELDQELRSKGTKLSQIKENFRLQQMATECFLAKADPPIPIDETEIRDYYESHGSEFDIPGVVWWKEYRISRSSKVADDATRAKLTQLSMEMKQSDTENVQNIIHRYSDGSELIYAAFNRAEAGSQTDLQLSGRLFSMPLDQWSDVIERPDSICLIQVLNRVDPRRKSLQEAEEEIRQKLIGEQNISRARKVAVSALTSASIQTEYELPDIYPLQN